MNELLNRILLSPDTEGGGGTAVASAPSTDAGAGGNEDGGPSDTAPSAPSGDASATIEEHDDAGDADAAAQAGDAGAQDDAEGDAADDDAQPQAGYSDEDLDRWISGAIKGDASKAQTAEQQPKTGDQPQDKAKEGQAPAEPKAGADSDPFAVDEKALDAIGEDIEETKPLIVATKNLAKFASQAHQQIAEQTRAIHAIMAHIKEAPIHQAIDGMEGLDAKVFGHWGNGQMTDAQYEKRVAMDRLAGKMIEQARAEGAELSVQDARMAAMKRIQRMKPAATASQQHQQAKKEVFQEARQQAATRTPAALRGGVSTKQAAAKITDSRTAWERKLDKALGS